MAMQLYPPQIIGVDFLTSKSGKPHKMLADAPGVGKTATTCGALKRIDAKSALIICPAPRAVKHSWRRHLLELGVCEPDDIQIINSTKDTINTTAKFKIVNYELICGQNKEIYRVLYWNWYDVVIVDESHRLKSLDSKRSLKILGGGSGSLISRGWWKWLLTGTPMPNRPIELYPTLSALCPELLGPYASFPAYIKQFCAGYYDGEWHYKGASNIEDLTQRLAPFFLRRELDEVYNDIPPVIEKDLYIDIGEIAEDETNCELSTLRKAIGIAKLPWVIEYVQYRLKTEPGEKFLVFTYNREVSEGIHKAIPGSVLIYGGMTQATKDAAKEKFQNDSLTTTLVAQLNSAGEALDGLQFICNNIIHTQPDWVPGGFDQQIARVRRKGQTKPTYLINCIAENTHEETIIGSRLRKQKTITKFHSKPRINGDVSTTQKEDEMTIEAKLDRNNELLEQVVELLKGHATPSQPKSETPKVDTKPAAKESTAVVKEAAKNGKDEHKWTAEDVRAAAAAVIEALGESNKTRKAIQDVVKAHGAKNGKADGVPAGKMAAAIEAINALAEDASVDVEEDTLSI